MKKIINGRRYDTDTAREIGRSSCIDTIHWWIEVLYRKNTGEYFLHRSIGNDEQTLEDWIIPMTISVAQDWANENMSAEEYKQIFEVTEDNQSKRTVTFSLTEATIEKIARMAVEQNCGKSEVIERLVSLVFVPEKPQF